MERDITSQIMNKFAWLSVEHQKPFTMTHDFKGVLGFQIAVGEISWVIASITPEDLLEAYLNIASRLEANRHIETMSRTGYENK